MVKAADVLVRTAADPYLGLREVFGLMVAAEAIDEQLSGYLGSLESLVLSGEEIGAIARLQARLPKVAEEYNVRVNEARRHDEIEREEQQRSPAEAKAIVEKWKSPKSA